MQLIPGGWFKNCSFLREKKYFLNLIEIIRFFQMLYPNVTEIWGLNIPPTSPTPQYINFKNHIVDTIVLVLDK